MIATIPQVPCESHEKEAAAQSAQIKGSHSHVIAGMRRPVPCQAADIMPSNELFPLMLLLFVFW
jgi:hypothetical protein